MQRIRIGLVGAGMFGGDVHLRAYAGLQKSGLAPYLGRLGLDAHARNLAGVDFELAAIATRTEKSARQACELFTEWTGHRPRPLHGETPWLNASFDGLDLVAVATPDHLHTPVIMDALNRGAHVISEKPLCLTVQEADEIIALAARTDRIVAVDMHKRYDPDHLRIKHELSRQIGEPLYGTAYLEEPLEVSTSTFKWVEQSDPFSYVGPHWVDLFYHYYGSKPVSLTAVGQKRRLRRQGIDAYDAVQVRVDFANGMSIQFQNNWITPADFEGPVNQGHEIVGTDGKVESDQQYRGLRWWRAGGGSRTANTHFTRSVARPEGGSVTVGYGIDSIVAGVSAVCRKQFLGAQRGELAGTYPDAVDARIVVAVLHAARIVRDLNFDYLARGKGAPVTARFGSEGITIVDPCQQEPKDVFRRIYDRPI